LVDDSQRLLRRDTGGSVEVRLVLVHTEQNDAAFCVGERSDGTDDIVLVSPLLQLQGAAFRKEV
jgi:hypothetical protein